VLSGRGLCDELITRPEESYRLWCVVQFDLENLKNEEVMTRVGSQRHRKKHMCLPNAYEGKDERCRRTPGWNEVPFAIYYVLNNRHNEIN
jgi:hypothetical protein